MIFVYNGTMRRIRATSLAPRPGRPRAARRCRMPRAACRMPHAFGEHDLSACARRMRACGMSRSLAGYSRHCCTVGSCDFLNVCWLWSPRHITKTEATLPYVLMFAVPSTISLTLVFHVTKTRGETIYSRLVKLYVEAEKLHWEMHWQGKLSILIFVLIPFVLNE